MLKLKVSGSSHLFVDCSRVFCFESLKEPRSCIEIQVDLIRAQFRVHFILLSIFNVFNEFSLVDFNVCDLNIPKVAVVVDSAEAVVVAAAPVA